MRDYRSRTQVGAAWFAAGSAHAGIASKTTVARPRTRSVVAPVVLTRTPAGARALTRSADELSDLKETIRKLEARLQVLESERAAAKAAPRPHPPPPRHQHPGSGGDAGRTGDLGRHARRRRERARREQGAHRDLRAGDARRDLRLQAHEPGLQRDAAAVADPGGAVRAARAAARTASGSSARGSRAWARARSSPRRGASSRPISPSISSGPTAARRSTG